jgi:putative peptidoglycan lipid II flippase
MIRVALTGILGYLFALPLRPLLIEAMNALHIQLPRLPGGTVPLGAIALTATAGVAGWLEFMLLRRSLTKRIGSVHLSRAFLAKLWLSAIVAGILALLFDRFGAQQIAAHLPFRHIGEAIFVCGLYGVVYFVAAMLLRVEEARATLGRFLLRSRP